MDIQQIKNVKLNFILATGRTGSTLLSSMLNMHPNVISPHEEPFSYTLYQKYGDIKHWTSKEINSYCNDFYFFLKGKLNRFGTKEGLRVALETHKPDLTFEIVIHLTYLSFFPEKDKTGITTIVDKQLGFHSYLEKVAEIYPKSKFLILIRDPRDQILSRILLGQIRNEKKRNYLLWAYVWNYKYNTLLSKAVKIEENRFLKIKYEDLILNPEKELRKICGFFDISYNSQMLDYDENFKKLGNDINFSNAIKKEFLSIHSGLLKKVDSKKIGLWKKGIEQKDANLIWTICGPLAERLGYKRDEHFVKQPLKLKEYFIFLMFYTKYIVTPKIYYPSPFFVKYFINYVLRKKINRLKK